MSSYNLGIDLQSSDSNFRKNELWNLTQRGTSGKFMGKGP
ncbi:hypothetical protein LEP1GSC073_3076 [Leptospira noguchii str. Cascata]|nr:hypothetical protein LEP1GSC073_3076 [Leptospira noguchii str. Cascata]